MRTLEEMNILVVDDSRMSRNLITTHLAKNGFAHVVTAASAEEALDRLVGVDGAKTDLILMDIVMKEMDGIEAVKRIKASPVLRDIPIVMVSAVQENESLEKAFAVGAVDYIHKPIEKTELRVRVRSALRLKRETDQRKDREGKLVKLAGQLQEANTELHRLSNSDGLTGIANRRFFDETLDREWRRCRREGAPLALALADVDFFKKYNDHYGHQAGDDCLRQVGKAIAATAHRTGDLAARYGGEEFVLVLPGTDADGGRAIAERFAQTVREAAVPHAASDVAPHVTVSVGVAVFHPDDGRTPKDLIEAADKALYEAKHGGRNRVSLFAD
jgi:diguanylate cyclase (GGDEF)-like protein